MPYQWKSSTDNSTFVNITDATTNSYAIASDQSFVDKYLHVQVTSTDSRGGTTVFTSASQQIANVNDPPSNITLSATQVNENMDIGYIIATISATDVDSSSFTYTLGTTADADKFTIVGDKLKSAVSYDFETKNSYSIDIIVNDGALPFTKTFTISVLDVNEAPTSITLSWNAQYENSTLGSVIGHLYFVDPDAGDTITFTVNDTTNFYIRDGNRLANNQLFDYETKTTYNINVTATDSGGLSITAPFTIMVWNVVEGPTDILLSSITVNENVDIGTTVATISAVTHETTVLTFSQIGSHSGSSLFSVVGNELRTAVELDYESSNATSNSKYLIQLKVVDNNNKYYTKYFNIEILNVNDAPNVINPIGNVSVDEDAGQYTIQLANVFSDDDSDAYTLSAVSNNTNLVTTSIVDNTLTLTFISNANGSTTVDVKALETSTSPALFGISTFTVTVNAVNDTPTVENAIADVNVNEDASPTTIALASVFADVDSDTLGLTVVSNDTSLVTVAIVNTTLTLSYVANANGNTTVVVTATESSTNPALYVTDTFTVTVAADNDTPTVANAIADVNVTEDASPTTISLASVFADIESDALTLTVVSNNTNLVTAAIVGTTLTLTYVENANGNTTVVVTATETSTNPALFVTDTFTVTVAADNDTPTVANAIADVNVTEDASPTTISLASVFADIESDTLALTVVSNDTSLVTAAIVNTTLTLTYVANANGNTTVVVTATETSTTPALFVSDTFTVTVAADNDTPTVANAISDVTVDEDASPTIISLESVFADVESDALTLTVVSNNTSLVTAAIVGTTLTLTYVTNANGNTTVVVTATETSTSPALFVTDTY